MQAWSPGAAKSPPDADRGAVKPVTRKRYWLTGVGGVIVLLVVITTLHLGTQISPSAQRALYRETVELVNGERGFAIAHGGGYAGAATDLATADPQLAFLIEQNSPLVQYNVDNSNHGYFVELADQSTGGAASFSVLVSDNDTVVTTCTGPGPLCSDGRFKLPHDDFAINTDSQRELYEQTVTFLRAERAYAATHHGQYGSALDLATFDSSLAFAVGPGNPVNQFFGDSSNHGYYVQFSNENTGGSASFSALVPEHGAAVLTCVGAAPLCSKGAFKVPTGTVAPVATNAHG